MEPNSERLKLQDFMDSQEGVCWRNASETLKVIEAQYPNLPIPAATKSRTDAGGAAILCWNYPGLYMELEVSCELVEWYVRTDIDGQQSSLSGHFMVGCVQNLMLDYLISHLIEHARQLDTQP